MRKQFLIVEDDPEITSALMRGLALHGYEAEAENRAGRALARLERGAVFLCHRRCDAGHR